MRSRPPEPTGGKGENAVHAVPQTPLGSNLHEIAAHLAALNNRATLLLQDIEV